MTQISGDFLKATSAKEGDKVYVVLKKDDGQYVLKQDVIKALEYVHGPETDPIYAGTTESGLRFTLVDKTGEIPATTNKLCQIFRDKHKVHDFLDAERKDMEAAHLSRMESITAISLDLRKA